jgi:hypothetical protein
MLGILTEVGTEHEWSETHAAVAAKLAGAS